jgi:hypothetical protein
MINQIIRYKPVIDFIKKRKKYSLCEIGSGNQGVGKFLNVNFIGVDSFFNDYDEERKINKNKKMKQILAKANKIPIKTSSIDLVFSLDTFEHIEKKEREKSLNEILRIAKEFVIIGFPCGKNYIEIDNMINKLYCIFNKKPPLWLEEHLKIDYNEEFFMDEILKRKGFDFYSIKNENVWVHFFVIIIEGLPFFNRISDFISKNKTSSFYYLLDFLNFGKCYRKIYFINCNKKKYENENFSYRRCGFCRFPSL